MKYQITTQGIVKNEKGRILKPFDDKNGYLVIYLWEDGKRKRHKVHKLVAERYLPKIKGKKYLNHLNGNKKDNRIDNLEWCTQKQNCIHSIKKDLQKPKKLSKSEFLEIFKLFKSKNISRTELSKKYNVSYAHVCRIISKF